MSKKIYVGNLPVTITVGDVVRLLEQHGGSGKVSIENKGRTAMAIVDVADDATAATLVKKLKNAKVGGNVLNVNEARP